MLLSPASKRFLTRYMDLIDELNLQELFNQASLEFNDRIINEITSADKPSIEPLFDKRAPIDFKIAILFSS